MLSSTTFTLLIILVVSRLGLGRLARFGQIILLLAAEETKEAT